MPKHGAHPPEALADEIRKSAPAIVAAACQAFKECMVPEYFRLRASAIESGDDEVVLEARLRFNIRKRTVVVETVPVVQPKPHRRELSVNVVHCRS